MGRHPRNQNPELVDQRARESLELATDVIIPAPGELHRPECGVNTHGVYA
jgi:hypothetical protein